MERLNVEAAQPAPRGRAEALVRVGLVGHGIQLSRTPRMHCDEGARLGLRYRYELFDTDRMPEPVSLPAILDAREAEGFVGLNITHPFKQSVIAHLDHLSDAARAVNAVNTVVFRDGRRYGHNTDYWGFCEALRLGLPDAPRGRVLQLGAGGAGGAVANALIDSGTGHLAIFDPSRAAAERLAESLGQRAGTARVSVAADVESALAGADGVVNASPVGMASHPGTPVPEGLLTARLWVADIIYFPLQTRLLAAARARGCRTMDGSGMAVFQAVRAFELFSGLRPDPAHMRATFDTFDLPSPQTTAGAAGI